jgi:plastocyanin
MRRREFLRTAGGAAGVATAAAAAPGSVAAVGGDSAPASVVTADGGTVEVAVGPGGDFVFEPGTDDLLAITPGTTVDFLWESNTHNIVVESQPADADWAGYEDIENEGFEYSHTFDTRGTYEYYCNPHRSAGMVATLVVTDDPAAVTPSGTVTPTPAGNGTMTPAGNETMTPGGSTGGTTHTVDMTDGLAFEPSSLTVAPGDTVVFENVGSVGHSVTAYEENIPEGAGYWASGGFDSEDAARSAYSPSGGIADTGNVPGGESWSHTFETEGVHEYFCIPHEGAGMVGQIEVSADTGGGGEGGGEVDPEEMGVPFQAHWVGIATILGIGLTLLLTFFFLKYGETPHSGYPEER